MKLYLIIASTHGKTWIVEHAYAGPAAFISRDDAAAHVDQIRATGATYRIVAITADDIGTF